MPQGLQVFSTAGAIVLDITDRLPRLISVWNLNPTLSSDESTLYPYDSPAVAGLANDGSWFVSCTGCANRLEFIGGNRVRMWFFTKFTDTPNVQVLFGKY